jgi:hypothetical protein
VAGLIWEAVEGNEIRQAPDLLSVVYIPRIGSCLQPWRD